MAGTDNSLQHPPGGVRLDPEIAKPTLVQVLEIQESLPHCIQKSGAEKTLVDEEAQKPVTPRPSNSGWNGPDDPDNPKNWPIRRKWLATITVAMFTFITPVASSMIAPALEDIASELGVAPGLQTSMLLSIFVLAYIPGPLVLGPMSEVFGRTRVLQMAYMFFLVFCLACGSAQTKGQFLAFRLISGLGGSAPLAIGPGVLADLWPPEQRGRAIGFYTAGKKLVQASRSFAKIGRSSAWSSSSSDFRRIDRTECIMAMDLLESLDFHWYHSDRRLVRPSRDVRTGPPGT